MYDSRILLQSIELLRFLPLPQNKSEQRHSLFKTGPHCLQFKTQTRSVSGPKTDGRGASSKGCVLTHLLHHSPRLGQCLDIAQVSKLEIGLLL